MRRGEGGKPESRLKGSKNTGGWRKRCDGRRRSEKEGIRRRRRKRGRREGQKSLENT